MHARTAVFWILLALALSTANAQSKPAPPKPAPAVTGPVDEPPDDQKAYQDANRIGDPAKKIEALEQFKKDFPDSSYVENANTSILSTLVNKMPGSETRIRDFAQSRYDAAAAEDKGKVASQMAGTLFAGHLLDDARGYAEIALQATTRDRYLQDQKASYAKRKQKPPAQSELMKRYQTLRADRLALLGRVEVALGHTEQGQKLLEEADAASPESPVVAGALGELAAKSGNHQKAMDYLLPAQLTGKAPAGSLNTLKSEYRILHNQSLNGFDAWLDAEYNKRYANPLHLDAYKPSKKRTDRLVLAEVFTGSGCPPCVGADLAFEAAMHRYSTKDLVVVMYHQHVPQPDPMSNPDAQARNKYYNVTGVPTYAIDGATVNYHGMGRSGTKMLYGHIQPPIEQELEKPAEAGIKLQAKLSGNTVTVAASVDGVKGAAANLKVHILLVEQELRYIGENGIRYHPMVVRAMGGEKHDGFALTAGAGAFDQTWDLNQVSAALRKHLDDYEAKGHRGAAFEFKEKKDEIDRGDLAIVAFVQDAKTRHILQTAIVDLKTASGAATSSDSEAGAK